MHVLSSWHWNMALQTVGTEDSGCGARGPGWGFTVVAAEAPCVTCPLSQFLIAILANPISVVGTDRKDASEVPRHSGSLLTD